MDNTLTSYYDNLKNDSATDDSALLMNVQGNNGIKWRNQALQNSKVLCDKCCKHILLDIYFNILPLDDDYKCGHKAQMIGDIDSMLAAKGLTATQYLKSCSESTNSSLAKFLNDSMMKIQSSYMAEKESELKNAQDNHLQILAPVVPEMESPEVAGAVEDIKDDTEYSMFIEALKKKTAETIIKDISDVINSSNSNKELQYKPNTESATQTCIDYINTKLMKENREVDTEAVLGLAIRESTLREIDKAFKVAKPFNEFRTQVYFGHSVLLTEAAITELK